MQDITKQITTGGVTIIALILFLMSFTIIGAGHRGVVTKFGKVQDYTLDEGFHFKSLLKKVKEYDVRTQKIETNADAASKDLQTVSTDIALNFRVRPETVASLYQQTQGKYADTLIAPVIQEAVKAATAQFTAGELITKRAEVKEAMRSALNTKEGMKFFIVEDVSIVNFSFSDSFDKAIESKVRAEQDALASKNKLEQTKYEAEQKVVSAQAEAEAIRIQAQAVTSQGGKDYVQLQAIAKWDGKLPTNFVPGSAIPFLNLK